MGYPAEGVVDFFAMGNGTQTKYEYQQSFGDSDWDNFGSYVDADEYAMLFTPQYLTI